MRAAVCERPAYGAYEHDAKADSANIGFRQDVIAAAQQFYAENAPVKNEQDERGGQPPRRNFLHVCSALDRRQRRETVPAVQANLCIPAVVIAAVAGHIVGSVPERAEPGASAPEFPAVYAAGGVKFAVRPQRKREPARFRLHARERLHARRPRAVHDVHGVIWKLRLFAAVDGHQIVAGVFVVFQILNAVFGVAGVDEQLRVGALRPVVVHVLLTERGEQAFP